MKLLLGANPPFWNILCGVFMPLFLFSCEDDLLDVEIVYSNDFSGSDLAHFDIGEVEDFYDEKVLGFFHDEEVKLTIPDLPPHNAINVTLELLVHDSWDGNPESIGGPDFWYLHMDGQQVLHTTFSNSPCESTYCLYQSYPENYPRFNEPKTGALDAELPGRCQYEGIPGWTSRYRISRTISHQNSEIEIVLGDHLKQENAIIPLCDESWSLSKIEVSILNIK